MSSEKDKKTFGGCVLLAGGLFIISIIGLLLGGNNLAQFRFIGILLIVALVLYFKTDIVSLFKDNNNLNTPQ